MNPGVNLCSTMMRKAVAVPLALAFVAALGGPPAIAQSDPFEGKTFTGEIIYPGKTTGEKSTFVFNSGKFKSSSCERYGFSDGGYVLTRSGESVEFEATTASESEGTQVWKGRIKGNVVEGETTWMPKAKWYRPNPQPVIRTFRGTLS